MRKDEFDDRQRVRQLLQGDAEAFDRFVDVYYPRLYRFALARVGADPEVAQDIVQSTFEKLIPRLGSYRGEAALFTWMCSFCRFEIAAYWRRRGRRQPEVPLSEDTPGVRAALETLAEAVAGPEERAHRLELARLVWVTLDHLPVHYGDALRWKYLKDLSVREIADRLELSPTAAESLLTRARQAFRDGFAAVMGGTTS